MKNLIEIKEVNGKKLVSARDLYLGLGLDKSNWAKWYNKNISNNSFFLEGRDWIIARTKYEKMKTIDFAITLEFAKHIAMMARTEKSHEYRNYFIECEKQLIKINEPKSSLDLLELQVKTLKEVESKVEKVDKKFDELPLFKVDSKSLTKLANSKMVALLGGKGTNAYKTLNRKAFSDMYKQLHREFGINSIDEIKRKDLEYAKKVICDYTLPLKLKNEVKMLNSQMKFNTEAI